MRIDPYQVVKAGSARTPGRRITFREVLLGAQIAICAVLVTSSMVALRGLARSLHSNFGFEPRHTIVANTNLTMAGHSVESVPALQRRMIAGARLASSMPAGMPAWRAEARSTKATVPIAFRPWRAIR